MKKICSSFFTFFIAFITTNAQVTFQKIYNGSSYTIGYAGEQTSDGGFILAGATGANLNYSGATLIKTNANGDTLWTRTYDGPSYDIFHSVHQTADGGYIAAGYSQSYLLTGASDFYLVKTNSTGNITWSKSYGDNNSSECWKVIQTTDLGYLMVGYSNNTTLGVADLFVIKTDAFGDTMWTRAFGNNTGTGGISIFQANDGGYVILGTITNYVIPFYDVDIYLLKISANGNTAWVQSFGGTSPEHLGDLGAAMAHTLDNGIIIAGYGNNWGAGANEDFLIKLDSAGNIQWAKCYGGPANEQMYDVKQAPDSGYIFVGFTQSIASNQVAYAVRTDKNGDTLWTRAYLIGLSSEFLSVDNTTDGGFIFTGVVHIGASSGVPYFYLVKTDANGNSGCSELATLTQVATITPTGAASVANIKSGVIYGNNAEALPYFSSVSILCFTTGINETNTGHSPFTVYPNPSDGNFIFKFDSPLSTGSRIELINILGQNVFMENISDTSPREFHLKNISSGIYFVKFYDGGKQYTNKLIIDS